MKKNPSMGSPVDNSSILYLALMRRSHTNVYRFTITLTEDVCPDILQRAVGIVYRRFPTVFAGFHPGFFSCLYGFHPGFLCRFRRFVCGLR